MPNRHFLIAAITLLGFSYATTTVILLGLGASTGIGNVIIKSFILILFMTSLVISKNIKSENFKYIWPMLVFFIIYGVRILYDISFDSIVFYQQSAFYIIAYFFGLTLVPTLITALAFDIRQVKGLHNAVLVALVIANVALLIYVFSNGTIEAETAFGGRAQVDGAVEGTAVINPITVSLMGAILAVFVMGRLAVLQSKSAAFELFLGGLVVLGFVNVLIGGSRGPAVAFALCAGVILLTLVRTPFARSGVKVRSVMWIYGGIGIAALIAFFIAQGDNIYLFERFVTMIDGRAVGVGEERDFLRDLAVADFWSAPIFGYSYVTSVGGAHPHNIVLEALMATGVVGFSAFLLAMFFALRGVYNVMLGAAGPYGYSLGLVTLCFLTSSLLSGAVGQFPELWVFLALMTTMGNRRQNAGAAVQASVPATPRPITAQ